MSPVRFSTVPRSRVVSSCVAFAVLVSVVSFAGDAAAEIIYNGSPAFTKTGQFYGTYSVLPNAAPNGGGFFLIQNAAQPAYTDEDGEYFPSSPASSRLSSFSVSHFRFAVLDQVVNSSLVLPSNTQLSLVNGTSYVAFDVKDVLNGNTVYYGWMNVTASGIGTMGTVAFTLNAWAYERTGASIKVGETGVTSTPVPEIDSTTGSSALSLVAGAIAIVEKRRRSAVKAALLA